MKKKIQMIKIKQIQDSNSPDFQKLALIIVILIYMKINQITEELLK